MITAPQPPDPDATLADANAYLGTWTTGGPSGHDLVMLWNAGASGRDAPDVQIARGTDFDRFLPDDERAAIVDDSMASYLAAATTTARLRRASVASTSTCRSWPAAAASAVPAPRPSRHCPA